MKENIGLMPKTSKEVSSTTSIIDEQLEVVKHFSELIDNGQVDEFMIIGIDENNQMVMASYYNSVVTGVGLLEMGKYALMNSSGEE